MENSTEELYEILDDFNERIEDIIHACNNPETLDLILQELNQKVEDFLYDFQQEIEKIELIEDGMLK